jgi:hypothetical protein
MLLLRRRCQNYTPYGVGTYFRLSYNRNGRIVFIIAGQYRSLSVVGGLDDICLYKVEHVK